MREEFTQGEVRRTCYQCHTTYRTDSQRSFYDNSHPTWDRVYPDPNLCPTCARSQVNNIIRELGNAQKAMSLRDFDNFKFKREREEEDRQRAIEVARWLHERRKIVESPQPWACKLHTPNLTYQTNGSNASFYLSRDPRYGYFPFIIWCPACSEDMLRIAIEGLIESDNKAQQEGRASDNPESGILLLNFLQCEHEQRELNSLGRLPNNSGEVPIVPEMTPVKAAPDAVAVRAKSEATQRDRGCCVIL
jgi:hypothetical protein